MERGPSTDHGSWIGLAALGFLYSFVPGFFAILLAGGGHGWCTPMTTSLSGLLLLPLFGASLGAPRSRRPRVLPWFIVGAMVLADLYLVVGTSDEGIHYFEKSVSLLPGPFIFWLVLWFAWQLGALVHAIWTSLRLDPA